MKAFVKQERDRKELFAGGLVQSVYPPLRGSGYWEQMIPDTTPRTALVLGVGGGTICRLLLEKYPSVKITGVDISPAVLRMASQHFGLGETGIDIVIDDAFKFVKKTKKKYDLVLVDLFDGYWFPLGVLLPPFVERCKELLTPSGQLFINTVNIDYLASKYLPTAKTQRMTENTIYIYLKDSS